MAGLMIAKLVSLAVLFAAPVAQASPSDARSCGLCWETATNQVGCTGIFDESALEACLCKAGSKATFDLCETPCAGTDRAPSAVCPSTALVERESQACALCWETATNQAHDPICTGLSDDDTAACLCKQGNREIFNTCNTQCKGFPKYMPKNTCRKVAARDDKACATCWNAEIAERCPGLDNSFAQQMCLCLPRNAPDFISKCDPVCADSVVRPSDACVHVDNEKRQVPCWAVPHGSCTTTPGDVKRVPQGESILPWKHEGLDDDDNEKRQSGQRNCWNVPHGSCSPTADDMKRDPQGKTTVPPCGAVPKSSCGMRPSDR